MYLTLTMFLIASLFPLLIIMSTLLLNSRSMLNFEKLTPFECGFDPSSSARIPFSMRFFILAVIFLVFDIEIALLMPAPLLSLSPSIRVTLSIFFVILMLGLVHEWNEGSLEWS
uniref:NADH-ubiquinone oxidoreductase chain 3 n=2 Tax=Nereididae TaxID=39820 RepID=A0A343J7G0_9ANNE|nr:NADH dehydrogenase subunit 3 [Neanthes glandicincta]ASW20410.1 NADH dehydrogenase subunit 3 [Neanthes glandicincta]QXU60616.1 NADH dehydrogenase subunit 3 [Dendronereis chipolini]